MGPRIALALVIVTAGLSGCGNQAEPAADTGGKASPKVELKGEDSVTPAGMAGADRAGSKLGDR